MAESDEAVTARRGRDVQRRSRRYKMLQEERRMAGEESGDYDSDAESDEEDGKISDVKLEDLHTRILQEMIAHAPRPATNFSEVYDFMNKLGIANGSSQRTDTDSSAVAAIGKPNINRPQDGDSTANATGSSQVLEADKAETSTASSSGSGSSGVQYINAFKPINARTVKS
ncbi:hypothetical protein LZ30DRAFT_29371 [Colletotrichum cereale]|nr:hypothetical protein LZ30DRAFT_29371 [Colletotrichum cereale]